MLALVFIGVLGFVVGFQAQDNASVDDEGFIRNWLVLPSIDLGETAGNHEEGTQKPMFDKEYFAGQANAAPKAGDKVKVGDAELEWKSVKAGDDSIVDLLAACSDAGKPTENCLVMGVCYILSDADISDVKLKIGSDDSSLWTLNGTEVVRVYEGRAAEKDQNTKEGLALKKGYNVLKFACINGNGEFKICARFVDKEDKPVKNLKISLTPPAK